MQRYVAIARKPRSWWAEEDEFSSERRTIDVIEPPHEPIDTGLLDASGVPLYRVNERGPIGFTK